MDLGKISVLTHDGTWLPITAPDGTNIGIEFYMVGRDSAECREATRHAAMNMRKKRGDISLDESELSNKKAVIACIKDWRDTSRIDNRLQLGEEELVCTFENKMLVLEKFPFMLRQADTYITDDANFFKVSE